MKYIVLSSNCILYSRPSCRIMNVILTLLFRHIPLGSSMPVLSGIAPWSMASSCPCPRTSLRSFSSSGSCPGSETITCQMRAGRWYNIILEFIGHFLSGARHSSPSYALIARLLTCFTCLLACTDSSKVVQCWECVLCSRRSGPRRRRLARCSWLCLSELA